MTRLGLFSFVAACSFTAATTMAQVDLRHNFDRADEYVVETINVIEQTLEIAGMEVETAVEQTARSRYRQGKRDGEGNSLVQLTMESLQATMELGAGLSINFDSNVDEQEADNPLLAPLVDSLKIASKLDITFTISPKGKVLAVDGSQKTLDAASPQTRQLLQQQLGDEAIKRDMQQEIDARPNRNVEEGDFWDQTVIAALGQGQVLTFGRRYEYVGSVESDGKMLHKIRFEDTDVDFSIEPGATVPLSIKESDLKIESSEGEILVDPESGRDVATRLKTRIVGSLLFVAGGQELPAELDLTIEVRATEIK